MEFVKTRILEEIFSKVFGIGKLFKAASETPN